MCFSSKLLNALIVDGHRERWKYPPPGVSDPSAARDDTPG